MWNRYWGLAMSAAVWVALSAISGFGATIQGVVTDTLTKATLESVLVTVKGTAATAYTNAQGVFTLNTTTGIRDQQASVPALAWSALREAKIRVYDVNGTYRATGTTNNLSGLPDGMYLIEAAENGQVYTGKIIKMHDSYQAGVLYGAAGKAAAAVTLVYTHKYYNTKEAGANEGDMSVTAKLRMWFPDAATTGPTGTLTSSRSLTVTQNNAVIQNLIITEDAGYGANIWISANNVTIRNCRIGSIRITDGYTGAVIEDCIVDWVGEQDFTLRRCEMSSASSDLIRVHGPNIVIEDCYIHVDGPESPGSHVDCIQEYPTGTSRGTLIARHNTMYNALPQNAVWFVIDRPTCVSNLVAGGGYTIYTEGGTYIGNHFSTRFYPNCGYFSPWTPSSGSPVFRNNIWHETGAVYNN